MDRKPRLGRPDPHTHSPRRVSVPPAVDWSTVIGGFVRWLSGLAPPPPGAGVRSQQPVVPCAPSASSLHSRAHAQGKTCAGNQTNSSLNSIKRKHVMPVALKLSVSAFWSHIVSQMSPFFFSSKKWFWTVTIVPLLWFFSRGEPKAAVNFLESYAFVSFSNEALLYLRCG